MDVIMSWDDEEDCPPPLASLPEQVAAAARRSGTENSEPGPSPVQDSPEQTRQWPVASTLIVSGTDKLSAKPALKKGFFNSKPAASTSKQKAAGKLTQQCGDKDDGITVLKGKKDNAPGGAKCIPEFLRVEPDEQEKKYSQMKTQLMDALKPTADTIEHIAKDPQLLAGFDDPEVMAAVNDIAANPQNMKKYANNKKVMAFYSAMAGFAGQKLSEKTTTTKS